MTKFYLILILLLCSGTLFAQFSGSNKASYQLGNQPGQTPSNQANLYNQLDIRFRQNNFELSLRAEVFSLDAKEKYSRISQQTIRYQVEDLQIQLGHFYEILGRGLLFRTYEIPGNIYESFDQRYGFYKDAQGLSLRYSNNYFSTKAFYGRPLDISKSPSFGENNRRNTVVQGAEFNFTYLESFMPGILFLRSDRNGLTREFGGLNFEGTLADNYQYYAEYVQDGRDDLLQLGAKSSHAFYSSISAYYNWVTFTAEFKDYNAFTLIFNDAPPAVREHSFTLLNRATHTVNPDRERGYQLEAVFTLNDYNTSTINYTFSNNAASQQKYYAWYADVNYYLSPEMPLKVFVDYSLDEVEIYSNRFTTGISLENSFNEIYSLSGEVQAQSYKRDFMEFPTLASNDYNGANYLFSLFFHKGTEFNIGTVVELSNDRVETGRFGKGKKDIFVSWPALNMGYQLNQNSQLTLFYGKRRSGNACTGGICYQIAAFTGLELRFNTKF